MADADQIARALHPATARQTGYPAWTGDPAIAALFAILRDLAAAGAQLEALHHDRPDLGAGAMRGDIGEVASLFERCPDRFFGLGWRTRANGGACAGLWQLLAAPQRLDRRPTRDGGLPALRDERGEAGPDRSARQ